jgi:hypothetical protein
MTPRKKKTYFPLSLSFVSLFLLGLVLTSSEFHFSNHTFHRRLDDILGISSFSCALAGTIFGVCLHQRNKNDSLIQLGILLSVVAMFAHLLVPL